ncbi:hypothetical protein LTR85_009097 [Meristemomyces frigidus]|nr:hypothetical protein LTR85_009097 [Meristemomyces frigidus]
MESIFAAIRKNTNAFNLGDEETWRELYEPFIPPPPGDITLMRDEQYGSAERNRLDVYVPSSTWPDKPVLLFVHGGGFFSGDKAWSEKCWGNIGYFFAQHDIVTVTIDHRLVPDIEYPGGADDIQLAREWVHHNIAKQHFGRGSPDKVVLMGHSSGGAHIAMNLYGNAATSVFPPVAGIMYFSVPFWYDNTRPIRAKTLRSYYGSEAQDAWRWKNKCALGLFEGLPDDSSLLDSDQIPTYIGTVKWEVKEACDGAVAYFDAYRARSRPAGTLPLFHVLDDHNHLSNMLSIGTADTSQSMPILKFVSSCAVKAETRRKPQPAEHGSKNVFPDVHGRRLDVDAWPVPRVRLRPGRLREIWNHWKPSAAATDCYALAAWYQ